MKKAFILFLVLALMLSVPCAQASPEDLNGQIFPDFSVKTISGSTFSLSESLRTHDLVLINFWATWCGPCCMEFPFLETAWEQYSDRVDVIALSIESTDTPDVLKSFAGEYGLNFPIGRDESGMFNDMEGSAIPTTLIVNKERRVVAVEIGSKSSMEEFTSLFDNLLSAYPNQNKTQGRDRFVLRFCDLSGSPIPGVTVAFCNGEYTPVDTDNNGRVSFDGDPNSYHIHLLAVPNGYSKPWEELHVVGEQLDLIIILNSANDLHT